MTEEIFKKGGESVTEGSEKYTTDIKDGLFNKPLQPFGLIESGIWRDLESSNLLLTPTKLKD